MLDVKISGSAEEIAALFRQLGAGESTTYNVTGDVKLRKVGAALAVDTGARIAPEDLPDVGANPVDLSVFGGHVDAPSEADGAPGPEVFGGAPDSAGAAQSSTAPVAMPGSLPAATSAPLPTSGMPLPLPVPTPAVPLPASAAPTAAPQSASPAPVGDLDKNGLPWNHQIHSESKAKNADQTWRMKRNLSPDLREKVEGELRALMAHQAPPPAVAPLPLPSPSTTSGAAAMPLPTPAPVAAAPAADFGQLFQRATAAIAAGTFTQDQLGTMLQRVGGTSVMPMLINRPDVWPVLDQNLTAMGA